jgi:cleavage and polyadenylation specificity factor subunit 1
LYAPEQTWPGRSEIVNNNCLVSLVTLAANVSAPDATAESGATTAILIATSPALPHSCLAVHPCPPDLGGVLIVTANGVLHLEQGGKVIGTPSNGWFGKEWLGAGGGERASNSKTVREPLEGAKVVFIANDKALFFCKSGNVLELTMKTSGRSVASMIFKKLRNGVAGSCVERIRGSVGRFGEEGYVFVGSEVGESALLRWEIGGMRAAAIEREIASTKLEFDEGMDIDEDGASLILHRN